MMFVGDSSTRRSAATITGACSRGCVWLVLAAVAACAPPTGKQSVATSSGAGSSAAGSSRPAPVAGKLDADDATAPNLADVPFTLRDQTGAEFSSSELEGRVWMGAIFFANCPGPCFRENQEIAEILRRIDDPEFMVVSLTCDPENDTSEALAKYAARFEADPARWKFLTGDLRLIEQVGQRVFRLPVELGVHSERGVVFDRQGRLRGGYHLLQSDRVDMLVQLIRDVLAEPRDAATASLEGDAAAAREPPP
jgi:protein SCO1/2